ncbi:hypothetical protein [Streptomyces sp. HB132]|uniref:hypothetical protein n=1 Tax=Streptomyces sp. HB132 TaxID=767388 RepID=UPI0019607A4F|nr:hypothetical protein [Streptomyces sp. HB132]MBM7443166.1 hypothetical protein [Streptomyces sp. HB132]
MALQCACLRLPPQDLLDAVPAERDQFAQRLPWSAEPLQGWTADKKLHGDFVPEKADSPGCTPEEAERLAGYRARILELTTQVLTHPYWATPLSGLDRMEARTTLKRTHDTAGPDA